MTVTFHTGFLNIKHIKCPFSLFTHNVELPAPKAQKLFRNWTPSTETRQ
jgi:hypothetical protein